MIVVIVLAGAVNYAEWGQTCKLCHDATQHYNWTTYIPSGAIYGTGSRIPEANDFTLASFLEDVILWKAFEYYDFNSEMRTKSLEFTTWGYNRTFPSQRLGDCCYYKSEVYPEVSCVWEPGMRR